jgi:quercetin dioxygenase-like cupin family protein
MKTRIAPFLAVTAFAATAAFAKPPAAPTTPTTAAAVAAPTRVVLLPGAIGAGEPKVVSMLVDDAALKLATIVLRKGTVLPSHSGPTPVTIVALQGAGTVVTDTERVRVDATHAVYLAPGVPHAVEPDAGTDLVLLVHHLKSTPTPTPTTTKAVQP